MSSYTLFSEKRPIRGPLPDSSTPVRATERDCRDRRDLVPAKLASMALRSEIPLDLNKTSAQGAYERLF